MPSSEKRERQRQNRDARRVAEFEAEKKRKRNRSIRNGVIFFVIFAAIVGGLSLLRSGDDSSSKSSSGSSSNVACGAKAPAKNTSKSYDSAPPMTIDTSKTYTAVMDTSCGNITITLDAAQAPQTVNSFVFLAKQGFYNGTLFHRIVTDFVDQGGDPKGDGTGGPGYTIPDEPPADGYKGGSVAMANAGSGTTGSQFFLVVSDSGAQQLGGPPYAYSSLGTMDAAGLKVAQKINTFGSSDSAGTPTKKVYVNSVTIKEEPGRQVGRPRTVAPVTYVCGSFLAVPGYTVTAPAPATRQSSPSSTTVSSSTPTSVAGGEQLDRPLAEMGGRGAVVREHGEVLHHTEAHRVGASAGRPWGRTGAWRPRPRR
ncbi:MAG: peptidylprolyl isomerase [Acidimicrobiia bacterium]